MRSHRSKNTWSCAVGLMSFVALLGAPVALAGPVPSDSPLVKTGSARAELVLASNWRPLQAFAGTSAVDVYGYPLE